MREDIKYYILVSVVVVAIMISGEILYRIFKVRAEYTRKMNHVLVGLIPITFPWMFDHHFPVLILNLQLIVLLLITRYFSILPSINKIGRTSFGSYIYPFVVYGLFLVYLQFDNKIFFLLPIVILAVCDPLAALSGMAYKALGEKSQKIRFIGIGKKGKSMAGSVFFAVSALVISLFLLPAYLDLDPGPGIMLAALIAMLSTAAEALGNRGLDNLTIPLSVLAVLVTWQYFLA